MTGATNTAANAVHCTLAHLISAVKYADSYPLRANDSQSALIIELAMRRLALSALGGSVVIDLGRGIHLHCIVQQDKPGAAA